jgi:hypothetical protein
MTSRRQFHNAALPLTALGALGALRGLDALAQAIDPVEIFYGFPAGSAGHGVARRVGEKLVRALSPWSALAIYPLIYSRSTARPRPVSSLAVQPSQKWPHRKRLRLSVAGRWTKKLALLPNLSRAAAVAP